MPTDAQSRMKEYVARQSSARLDRFAYELSRGRKSNSPDTVHDLRVSIRRYEACVNAFEGFFPARPARKFHERLREILKPAGVVRDYDIALELAGEAGLDRDLPLLTALAQRRKELGKAFQENVKRWTKRHPTDKWRRRVAVDLHGKQDPGHKSVWDVGHTSSENAAVVLPKMAQDFFRRGRKVVQPETPDRKLHRFRLRAKRFRYTLEIFRPCYGPTLGEHISAIKHLQDHLGMMNDCAATLDLLKAEEWSALDGSEQLKSYLEGRIQQERTRFFEYWESTFAPEDAEKRWTDYLERFAGRVAKSQAKGASVATAQRSA